MASIFDFLTGGGTAKPSWSYMGHEGATMAAPAGGATGFGAIPQPAAATKASGIVGRAVRTIPGVARFGVAAAPVMGALGAATDSQEDVSNLAAKTGLDYNSFGGRVGANVINFLKQTGDAATFGGASALGSGISNVLSGQPFFTPYNPTAAKPAVSMPSQAGWNSGQDLPSGPGAVAGTMSGTVTGLPPVAPLTAAQIRGNTVPASGTGGFVNNATGKVTNLDTREVAAPDEGYGAVPAKMPNVFSPNPAVGGAQRQQDVLDLARTVGGAAGGALQIAGGIGARKTGTAYNKLALDYALKAPGAQKDAAEAAALQSRMALANDPTMSASERAGILAGRPIAKPDQHVFIPTMDQNKVIVGNKTTGGAVMQTALPAARTASAADFAADVKRLGSRKLVLEEYAKRNITPPKE